MGCRGNAGFGERADSICHDADNSANEDQRHAEAGSAATDADIASLGCQRSNRSAAESSANDYCTLRFSTTASRCERRSKLHVPADCEPEHAIPVSLEHCIRSGSSTSEHDIRSCSSTSEHSASRGTSRGHSRAISAREETRSHSRYGPIHVPDERTLPPTWHSSSTSSAAVPEDSAGPTDSARYTEYT